MKKKKKKIGQAKATCEVLEGFVDWTNPGISKSAKEEETEMSGLVSGFTARMRKRTTSAHGETALGVEAFGEKASKVDRLRRRGSKESDGN